MPPRAWKPSWMSLPVGGSARAETVRYFSGGSGIETGRRRTTQTAAAPLRDFILSRPAKPAVHRATAAGPRSAPQRARLTQGLTHFCAVTLTLFFAVCGLQDLLSTTRLITLLRFAHRTTPTRFVVPCKEGLVTHPPAIKANKTAAGRLHRRHRLGIWHQARRHVHTLSKPTRTHGRNLAVRGVFYARPVYYVQFALQPEALWDRDGPRAKTP